jgi:RimJ/RimL family protein N-acetyltransferase
MMARGSATRRNALRTELVRPRLATARLELRPVAEPDLDGLVEGLNDFAVVRYLARVPFPYLRQDAEDFLASVRVSEAEAADLTLVIADAGRPVGCMGLARIGEVNELGYWLRRDAWGKGYATEAARAFLAHCFGPLGQQRIVSGVFIDNPASLNVQRKLGFRETGVSRRLSLARGGEVEHIDTVLTRARFEEALR